MGLFQAGLTILNSSVLIRQVASLKGTLHSQSGHFLILTGVFCFLIENVRTLSPERDEGRPRVPRLPPGMAGNIIGKVKSVDSNSEIKEL